MADAEYLISLFAVDGSWLIVASLMVGGCRQAGPSAHQKVSVVGMRACHGDGGAATHVGAGRWIVACDGVAGMRWLCTR